jgi:hypothetical protein
MTLPVLAGYLSIIVFFAALILGLPRWVMR